MFLQYIYKAWTYVFARPIFAKLNKLLFQLAIRGLGVLNYQSSHVSGEDGWVSSYLAGISSVKPVIFDVGGNEGNYTLAILNHKPDCAVYAFEPHPINFDLLLNKLDMKIKEGAVYAFNCAVGDVQGSLSLYDYRERDGSSHASLYREVIEEIHHSQSLEHNVESITLDEFCLSRGIDNIDLLKIDTEGNELKILIGAKQLLGQGAIKAIQFEFNEMNVISHSTFKDFWDFLEGFTLSRLLPGGRLLPIKNYSPLMCELYAFQNIVAIKNKIP